MCDIHIYTTFATAEVMEFVLIVLANRIIYYKLKFEELEGRQLSLKLMMKYYWAEMLY